MESIRIILYLVVLMVAGSDGQLEDSVYYLYEFSACARNDSVSTDISNDVPYGSSVTVALSDWRDKSDDNCSLVLTYTSALFSVKLIWVYMEEGTCVSLFDGNTTSASSMVRRCGSSNEYIKLFTTGPAILFAVDTTDEIVPRRDSFDILLIPFPEGATYFMEDFCSNDTLVHPNQTIWLHTNRGKFYDKDINCTMTLYTQIDHRLLIRIVQGSLGENDCLKYYDASGTNGEEFIKYCAFNNPPYEFESFGRFLTIKFETDSQDLDEGAVMEITTSSEDWECFFSDEVPCENYRICYWMGGNCDGYDHCPDGSDEKNCTTCESDVKCVTPTNEWVCIPVEKMCDGVDDCQNDRDEDDSRCISCYNEDLRCLDDSGYPLCVHPKKTCDGKSDCRDGEDEDKALCGDCPSSDGIRCRDFYGRPLCVYAMCDGYLDCSDGEDEDDAICVHNCTSNFLCHSNAREFICLPSSKICDSVADCIDGKDEASSLCASCSSGVRCKLDEGGFVCVDERSLCDSYEDCIDGQDESSSVCEPPILSYWSPGQLAGIFTGYIVFAVIVVVITCLIPKKCRPVDG
ncbi:low-density lipoprotein receptor-related protein 2-like [Patiria miniata]|uniref:CUB domain-containing protein n=1 Tax=Patiria miniata TaxID=46514 RepID=A0A914A3E7_PATMI|nr:low-density lipoprotein receptor-related protein 2-like [Patiria miniata]